MVTRSRDDGGDRTATGAKEQRRERPALVPLSGIDFGGTLRMGGLAGRIEVSGDRTAAVKILGGASTWLKGALAALQQPNSEESWQRAISQLNYGFQELQKLTVAKCSTDLLAVSGRLKGAFDCLLKQCIQYKYPEGPNTMHGLLEEASKLIDAANAQITRLAESPKGADLPEGRRAGGERTNSKDPNNLTLAS